MNTKKRKKNFEIYGVIGKSICACAGGIVGFVIGGPLMAIPGIILGSIVSHFLERSIINT